MSGNRGESQTPDSFCWPALEQGHIEMIFDHFDFRLLDELDFREHLVVEQPRFVQIERADIAMRS